MENTKEVEAYLRKFNVEEAVQAAVNSAILHKARDPILHVANFLEARGREHEANLQDAVRDIPVAEETPTNERSREREATSAPS